MGKLFLVLGALVLFPMYVGAADVLCTVQYQPVCGAQQVQCIQSPCYPVYHTYSNNCVLGAEGGTFIHEGGCTVAETEPVKPIEPYVPPAYCTAWFDGCNSCSRSASGQAMCTLRACVGEPGPGYCRAYEKPSVVTPPVVAPNQIVTSSTTPQSTDTVHIPEETTPHNSFLMRLWTTFLGWFSWRT